MLYPLSYQSVESMPLYLDVSLKCKEAEQFPPKIEQLFTDKRVMNSCAKKMRRVAGIAERGREEVFIGLGGNIGNTAEIFKAVIAELKLSSALDHFECSSLYETTPVETEIPQRNYLNMVCRFFTDVELCVLKLFFREIEARHGKKPKAKTAPRVIDIDLLLYGRRSYQTPDLVVPHPRWQERLFVLIPLYDIAEHIEVERDGTVERFSLSTLIATAQQKDNAKVRRV
ncbi:2-amino-4-hydroxy-6-hydroxymethyldihydropteridine diphosphokinase [Simkania negevensis]|uniref:2-amino-4-hydroxy-6-hydroxymethyldihydropteridine pyrophosphokinase n=1 Tax=Simkania negevensis TaxID=83561 RepID=A0ABS3ASC1_9BACT|nr:2-amino-4-hydroxy-6-hydroxymethyldihydropteridine diphosphokinase [Simkania negevensis]